MVLGLVKESTVVPERSRAKKPGEAGGAFAWLGWCSAEQAEGDDEREILCLLFVSLTGAVPNSKQ